MVNRLSWVGTSLYSDVIHFIDRVNFWSHFFFDEFRSFGDLQVVELCLFLPQLWHSAWQNQHALDSQLVRLQWIHGTAYSKVSLTICVSHSPIRQKKDTCVFDCRVVIQYVEHSPTTCSFPVTSIGTHKMLHWKVIAICVLVHNSLIVSHVQL